MAPVDKRGVLEEEIVSFRTTKDGRAPSGWCGRHVTTLRGKSAQRFVDRVAALSPHDAQLLMARVTGNSKRGNERGDEDG